MLNYKFLVLGFVIVGLLFVPPSIPYMVPIAEASPMDNPADAIDDLSLTSISKYSNQADRNSITLSWSAPNDNGSPILFYNIQVHEISGNGWTVLENDVYGTTYTHENAPTPYQFSYRVFAIAADGCNGSSSTFYNACNESNILHVVSLPNAESGAVNSSCNNSELDNCNYAQYIIEIPKLKYSPESYQIGETIHVSGTVSGAPNIDHVTITMYAHGEREVTIQSDGTFATDYDTTNWNIEDFPNSNGEVYVRLDGLSFSPSVANGFVDYRPDMSAFSIVAADTTPENDSSPATGPFTITDDSTGGDCSTIGTWSSASKTCTLNTDVATTGNNHGISIASSDIILDGAGHTVSGDNWNDLEGNSGVYVSQPVTGFVIKNFNIEGFHNGIKAYGTQSGTITENTVSSPDTIAINAYGARALQITDNTISNSHTGILMWNPSGNKECSGDGSFVVSGNNVGTMGSAGMRSLIADGICFSNNILESYFSVESDSKDVVIKNNQLTGSGNGFDIGSSSVLSMTDNTANSNLYNGFRFTDSNVITMTDNTANSNSMNGFTFNENSYASVFTGNTATGNTLNDFDGISETSSAGIVTVDSLSIGQHGTKNGGDCDSVGTWAPTDAGPEGGTCILTSDIQITGTGYGITLASSRVTLDGNGHTITGTSTESTSGNLHVGVWINSQYHTMVIKNLTIDTFAYGIKSYYTNGITISGVTMQNIGKIGIGLDSVDSIWIENNIISAPPISVTGSFYGMQLSGANQHVGVGDGSCIGTGQYVSPGIAQNAPMVIKNNQITHGIIQIGTATDWCIDGNTITKGTFQIGPSHLGIVPTNHIIKNNQVTNGGFAFYVYGDGNILDSNISNNNEIGFAFTGGSQNNVISNNIANNNNRYGFVFEEGNSIGHTFTNNTAIGNVYGAMDGWVIPPTNDLTATEIILTERNNYPQPWIPGNYIDYKTTIENVGPEISSSVKVSYQIEGSPGNILAYSGDLFGGSGYNFNSGETRDASQAKYFLPETIPGQYTLTFTIDPENLIAEIDETNNVVSITFDVDALPEQQSTDLAWSSGITFTENHGYTQPWAIGDIVQFSATVINQGDEMAYSSAVSMDVTNPLGQSVFGFADLFGGGYNLASGETRNAAQGMYFNPEMNYIFGTYTMTMVIDPTNIIPEPDEINNILQITFELTPEHPQKTDTCFPSSGYSTPWVSDPDTTSRDVTISGKLAPKQNGGCVLLNDIFLNQQSVVITATKNEVTKTATVTTDNNGFFNNVFSFTDDSDEGPWTITYSFDGDEDYFSNTELGNGDPNYVLNVPAPPPNPKPIVNVPSDITLYTGTPSFSFAQSTINYNLYSGNTGPVFYPQPTASITGVSSEIVTFDVTATDNDLSSGPTCDVTSGSEFSVGTTTVTCSATDFDGGVGTASFDVMVIEQTIGGSGQVSCTPGSNSQFPIGSTPVSCSVTDGQGNASSDTFAVNVQPKSPLTDSQCRAAAGSGHDSDSVFVCEYPFHVTVEEGQRLVWVDTQPWQGFYHHSLTSNNYLFDHTDAGVMDMLPSAWGGVGVYSFFDKLNTALSGSITIAESDTTAPNVNVPNDLVISTEDQNGTPVVTYSVSATDDREVVSGPTCNVESGSAFSIGTTEVTCTASDAAGNTGTDSFDVTVEYTYIDTTPPGFAAYDDISKATTNPAGTVVSYSLPTVTDNIGVTSGPTCDLPSGSVFPIGTTEVKCDASDAAGNPASISFNVVMTKTYVDNTAPAVYITFGETSDEIVVAADSSSGKELGFTVNAIDNVGVTVGPICSDAGTSLGLTPNEEAGYYIIDSKMYPIGNSFVVCTAYDAAGNSGSSIFQVTIQPEVADTTPPVITIPNTISSYTGGDVDYYKNLFSTDPNWPPTVTDNVDGDGPYPPWYPTCTAPNSELSNSLLVNFGQWGNNGAIEWPVGSTTITCSANDSSGNTGSASFTITVIEASADTPPPVINLPENYQVSPSSDWDGSSAESIVIQTFVVNVDDDRDYPYSNPNTIDCTYGSGMTADNYRTLDLIFKDSFTVSPYPDGSTQWRTTFEIENSFDYGTNTIRCTATDALSGNTANASFVITVEPSADTTPPEAPSIVHITGTMKKSTGPFDSSSFGGYISFQSPDNIRTEVLLTDDLTYDVVLLPGEYYVEVYMSDPYHNYEFEQWDVDISADQTYDVIFPVTTLHGKITDSLGNTLNWLELEGMELMRDSSIRYDNLQFNLEGRIFAFPNSQFDLEVLSAPENWIFNDEHNQNGIEYYTEIDVIPHLNDAETKYFEKGISNVDVSSTLNIVLDSLQDAGISITGTMKKSTGPFDSSSFGGYISFQSPDNIRTEVLLTDDLTYDVVLLPGEYYVEVYMSDPYHNYEFEQWDVDISADQTYDVIFPVTTLHGKITDSLGNTLNWLELEGMELMRDSSIRYDNLQFNLEGRIFAFPNSQFDLEVLSAPENWIFNDEHNQNGIEYYTEIDVIPHLNDAETKYFEKGISNVDVSSTLNIVLDSLQDAGISITGTMKKSTGPFDSSSFGGYISFQSPDNIRTEVLLTDDLTYDVVLLPGEYYVEVYMSDPYHNYEFEQWDVDISADQTYDVIFPVTTLHGKITDSLGNTLNWLELEGMELMRDSSIRYDNLQFNLEGRIFAFPNSQFDLEVLSAPENWIFNDEHNQNGIEYYTEIDVIPHLNDAETKYFEKGISNVDVSSTLNIVLDSFEDSGVSIPDSLKFLNSTTFEKYRHFEDSTDFTAISQTFKEGTTFGDGTTFRSDGTQLLPVGTIPSFGVMLEEFSCVTADCKPTDTSKFLSPGDLLPSGIDPPASFSKITSADKSFTIDGLGLEMTFDNVSGDGTIKTDLYDPANIPSSTDVGSGRVSVITNTFESISTIGSVIDLSVDTATVSGSITITMPYLESNVPAGIAESDLVVLHYTNNQWVTESNCTVDTLNNKITCTVTELSPFGIGSRSVTQTSEDENLDVDTTPPEFEEVNNILVDATTSNGATVTYEIPMATDDGGITDTPVCEPESGSFFPIGTTPVTCTVKDIAGIQGATVFLVTVKSLIAAPVEIPSNVSIKIGKSDYNTKEAIFVSGVASPFTEDNVSINVQDQSDNLVLVEQITPESSGVYTGIIFPNSLWSTSGNYTMSATYGTATDSVPFTFEFIQTAIDNSNIPTGITLHTNATGYALGDIISVTSQLTGGTSGQSIIIDVKDESGDNVVLQSLNTDNSGSTSLFFKAQDSWIPGKYNVTAIDGSPLWDYSTSELIQLVRPLPEITISPTVTTTESGDVITSYKAGEIGYFSTALLSESTSNVLVTINVIDSEGATLGVAFFKSIIGKGDSEIVLGFKIPEDAADGVAKIYVNTYTDWIDQGGIAISSELLSEVNIEGVISVENISDDGTVLVIPKSGSSVPGCEQSIQGCYLPNPTIINVGDTVSFSNTDTEPHTFTSGSPSNGPNGIFDSSVLMSGDEYEFTFEDEGKYDYFDMIRPWMAGTIVVGNSESLTVLPENIIPKFSDISDITQSASSSVGNVISYPLPIAIGGVITSGTTCTPAPGSMFPIGSTQVTCTATNDFGNTGMTSFMVTINPILQTADQSLSVKVGKDSYNNLEPLFVTGSVGKITGDSINLEVYDELNHLISIEQTTPKESGVYNTIITSNELWSNSGEYTIIAKYDSASAQDTFEFELIEVEKIISEQIPTELYVNTDNSAYILGDDVFIEMQLVGAGAGESILLEVRDSQNDQVLLQSLNTDSDGNADISYQLESTHDSGIYSIIVTSVNWDFITTDTFVAVAQIPDIIVGDVVSTLQDGTEVDSFKVGDIGYFQTPIISNSTSNVLITVNIFDVENTPLGLAYFNSKIVDDTFDIVLGLQIPENVMPGLATVYINTYTDWPNEGGVPILEEQVSFIEISPSSVSDLTLSTNSTSTNSAEIVP